MAIVPWANAGISKTPIGPFQTMVRRPAISLAEELNGLRTDIESHPFGGERAIPLEDLGFRVGRELVRQHVVDRQQKTARLSALAFSSASAGDIDFVGFDQRFAGSCPWAWRNV